MRIRTKNRPCYGCPNRRMVELDGRTVTCHAVCPEYKEARANIDEENFAKYELNQLVGGYFGKKMRRRKYDDK